MYIPGGAMLALAGALTLSPPEEGENDNGTRRCSKSTEWVTDDTRIITALLMLAASGEVTENAWS